MSSGWGFDESPFRRLLGIRTEQFGGGRAVVALDVDPGRHMNAMGAVHGGLIATMADVAAGSAVASALEGPRPMATIELKVNYLRPAGEGTLRAEGRTIYLGSRIAVAEVDVTSGGELVAKAIGTYYVSRGREG